MTGTKAILRTVVGGLVLAAVTILGGCGDGGGRHHHMSYGGRDSYPTYSHSDGGGHGGHSGGYAARSDGWRR